MYHFLDNQLGAVVVYAPVSNNGSGNHHISDFSISYNNESGGSLSALCHELLEYEQDTVFSVERHQFTLSDRVKQVWKTGTKTQSRFFHPSIEKHYHVVCSKIKQGVLLIAYDITAEASDKHEVERLAHAASHDLKEPLRKIIVYTDKLFAEHAAEMDGTGYGYLERVRTASLRMHRLVQDLLVFAEVGANKNTHEEVTWTNWWAKC